MSSSNRGRTGLVLWILTHNEDSPERTRKALRAVAFPLSGELILTALAGSVLRRAKDFPGHNHLDPPVLLAAGRGVIAGNGPGFSVALRRNILRLHSLRDQVAPHRIGAVLRELQIVLIATDGVGVAFH